MIARHQHEHEAINAREYPGTRQLCSLCEQPTGRCEEDSIFADYDEDHELGPICEECRDSFRENVKRLASADENLNYTEK